MTFACAWAIGGSFVTFSWAVGGSTAAIFDGIQSCRSGLLELVAPGGSGMMDKSRSNFLKIRLEVNISAKGLSIASKFPTTWKSLLVA